MKATHLFRDESLLSLFLRSPSLSLRSGTHQLCNAHKWIEINNILLCQCHGQPTEPKTGRSIVKCVPHCLWFGQFNLCLPLLIILLCELLRHSPPSTSWSIICDKKKFSIAWENKRASGKLQHVIRDISLIGRTTSGRCGSQMSKHLHTHTNTYIHINTHMQTHRHLACPIFTLKWKCNKQVTIKNSMTN